MADINNLASRLDAEFSALEQKIKNFQAQKTQQFTQYQQRLEKLGKVFDQLREIWRPRLELLFKKFEGRVQAKPHIAPSSREASFEFQSRLARVRLKLAAFTDRDIDNVILSYDLEIIPVLMRFKQHDEIAFPLDKVDKEAATKWIDDRIMDFVQTYFSMGENEIYLKDHMVEDPIIHVSFPKIAAATTLEWKGKTYYFVGEETRREFEKQQGIASE
jgi:YHS domain-containing protein